MEIEIYRGGGVVVLDPATSAGVVVLGPKGLEVQRMSEP